MADDEAMQGVLQDIADSLRSKGMGWVSSRIETRQCGQCTLCCTVKRIPDLTPVKPAWEPCPHLADCGEGCGIYPDRPPSCEGYHCAWRMGLGPDDARPDKIGVLIDVEAVEDAPLMPNGGTPMGLIIDSTGPYDPMPVMRAIIDAQRINIIFAAFQSITGGPLTHQSGIAEIAEKLEWHASKGQTYSIFESVEPLQDGPEDQNGDDRNDEQPIIGPQRHV